MDEEIPDIKNIKVEEGVQNNRYSTVNLTAKHPYFETVIKKSHDTFMVLFAYIYFFLIMQTNISFPYCLFVTCMLVCSY